MAWVKYQILGSNKFWVNYLLHSDYLYLVYNYTTTCLSINCFNDRFLRYLRLTKISFKLVLLFWKSYSASNHWGTAFLTLSCGTLGTNVD